MFCKRVSDTHRKARASPQHMQILASCLIIMMHRRHNLDGTCLDLVPLSPTATTSMALSQTSYRLSSTVFTCFLNEFSDMCTADPPPTVHLPKEDLPPTYRHASLAKWASGLYLNSQQSRAKLDLWTISFPFNHFNSFLGRLAAGANPF